MLTFDENAREILLTGRIDGEDARKISKIKFDGRSSYVLTIDDSTGGNVVDALYIYDTLSLIDCVGVVKTRADSAAAVILQACKLRFIVASANMFLHAVGIRKNYYSWENDIRRSLSQAIREYPKKEDMIKNINIDALTSKVLNLSESFWIQGKIEFVLKNRMNTSPSEFKKIMLEGKDFSSLQALQYGLVDLVI